MAFHNEKIDPQAKDTSQFLRNARETLRLNEPSVYRFWSVDRERDLALLRSGGGGPDIDDANFESWNFLDRKEQYRIHTRELSDNAYSKDEGRFKKRLLSYTFRVWGEPYPDAESLVHFKEALQEYRRSYLLSLHAFETCQVTLIDEVTGKEI
ncbi:MAG: hypothetical protein B7Y40_07990 [Gammaproteobacteria bacterium 28-57-27]|nr:MAG: hypothetical protein B7Y40_07990 [Gammaproteobacteria bacterium 28-57-27]